jgi:iron(III) transport system permease protein
VLAPALPLPKRLQGPRFNLDTPRVLFVVLALVLGYLVLVPFAYILRSSFTADTAAAPFTLQNYLDVFTAGNALPLLANSLIFALGAAIIAIPVGTLLAWIVERTNTPLKPLAHLSAYGGLAIPGVIKVIGWILLLGPQAGLINVWLPSLFGLGRAPFGLFGMGGMIMVEAIQFIPVVFLLMLSPFRGLDPSLQEAATMSGARPFTAFRQVTMRLAAPSVLAVSLLALVIGLEAFETPALVGIPAGIKVLTTQVYLTAVQGIRPRYGVASAYGTLLICLVAVGLWYYTRITRQASRFATITGKGMRPRTMDLGRWRWLTAALLLILPLLQALPLLVLLWAALLPYYAQPSGEALGMLTTDNFAALITDSKLYSSFGNSLVVGVAAATTTILLSAVVAWLVVRSRIRLRWLLDYVATLPLVFPGVVLGLALLRTYLAIPIPIYGSIWILALAFMTKYVPYGMRFCSPGLLQINRELDEGAQMSGAGWISMFRRVVLPLMAASLTGGWVYIFLLSMKELTVALLLYSPGTMVLSVRIFDMWGNGQIVQLAAFGVTTSAALALLALGFQKFTARYGLHV